MTAFSIRIISVWIIISVFSVTVSPVTAQPVALRAAENGQGFIFRHSGTCYAVFPRHVTGPRPRAQAITEGAASGPVSVRFPFWPGMDLAVGVVRRGAAGRCSAELEMLSGNRRAFARQGDGTLVLVDAQGEVTRLAMEVVDTNYLDFTARFSDPTVEARQGMSGAFLQVTGGLAGMAIESVDARTLRFMRIEEIGMNVERWLGTQGGVALGAMPEEKTEEAGRETGLQLVSASAVARSADDMPENLLTQTGAYVFVPDGPARIVFSRTGAEPSLSRLHVISKQNALTTQPQRLLVEVSTRLEGGSWRHFWTGEMPADGVLSTPAQLPTRAALVRLTVLTARQRGPVRIDQVRAE